MKTENKTVAVLAKNSRVPAGLFLIFSGLFGLVTGQMDSFLLFPAAVFLFFRRPKIVGWLMAAAAVIALFQYVPVLTEFLQTGQYVCYRDSTTGYTEYLPMRFVLLPILYMLAPLLFAGMLFTRGPLSLLAAALIVAAEIVATVLQMQAFAYVTGHPSPLSILQPFNYCLAAIFAGLGLWSVKPKRIEDRDGHTRQ